MDSKMNKRIQQLVEQANGSFGEGLEFAVVFGELEDFEKFAELIVRECADIAKHHVMNISTYADADFVDEQIKQHFGVEE
jgi:hypothetical protein